MKIHLRPEMEELVKQDVQRGPYQTVMSFVEHAISFFMSKKLGWLSMAARSGQKSSKAMQPHNAEN